MNKSIFLLVVVLLVIGGGVLVYNYMMMSYQSDTTTSNIDGTNDSIFPVPEDTDIGPPLTENSNSQLEDAMMEQVQLAYDGSKYTPVPITVKQGTTVVFVNNSNKNMWPASATHPTHEQYPGFDAKAPVLPKGTYSFKFDKVGVWKFHDHLSPTVTGSIAVE